MNISNNTVLITGGGSGIGLALAKEFQKNNNTVIITGRNLARLEKAQAANPGLEVAQCDVTDVSQIEALIEKCNADFGGINVLVNNAGVMTEFNYLENPVSIDEQVREMDIDFFGFVKMSQLFLPHLLKKQDAAIVNVTSGLAFVPLNTISVYCATKAAGHSWTQSLRWQLRNTSVKVFELMPPLTDTEMVTSFEGFKMMPVDKLASDFIKGFRKNKFEITPGQSALLKRMSRWMPGMIFKKLNQSFEK